MDLLKEIVDVYFLSYSEIEMNDAEDSLYFTTLTIEGEFSDVLIRELGESYEMCKESISVNLCTSGFQHPLVFQFNFENDSYTTIEIDWNRVFSLLPFAKDRVEEN